MKLFDKPKVENTSNILDVLKQEIRGAIHNLELKIADIFKNQDDRIKHLETFVEELRKSGF